MNGIPRLGDMYSTYISVFMMMSLFSIHQDSLGRDRNQRRAGEARVKNPGMIHPKSLISRPLHPQILAKSVRDIKCYHFAQLLGYHRCQQLGGALGKELWNDASRESHFPGQSRGMRDLPWTAPCIQKGPVQPYAAPNPEGFLEIP